MRLRLPELFLLPGAEFFQVGIDVLHAAVFGNELGSAHFSHTLNARHIIGRIPAEGQHVNYLRRAGDAPFLTKGLAVHQLRLRPALPGFQLEGVLSDELPVVLVRCDHIHVHLLRCKLHGNGAQHIVGLKTGDGEHGDVHDLNQLRKGFQRIYHQLRSGRAGAFVGRIQLVAEGAARRIESHRQMRGLLPLDHFQQVFGEAVQDGHIRPLGVDHGPAEERIVHLEYQRMPVYEEEFCHKWSKIQKISQ